MVIQSCQSDNAYCNMYRRPVCGDNGELPRRHVGYCHASDRSALDWIEGSSGGDHLHSAKSIMRSNGKALLLEGLK